MVGVGRRFLGILTVAILLEICLGHWGVHFRPFSTVQFLLVEPGSSLSECTAVCQCDGVDEQVGFTVARGRLEDFRNSD